MSTALPCKVPEVIDKALFRAGLSVAQVDWLLLHQANQRILDAVAERIFRVTKLSAILPTMAIPLPPLSPLARPAGSDSTNDIIAASGFGAGLTWGPVFIGAGEELSPRWGAEEQVMTKTAWVFPGKGPRQSEWEWIY